MDKKIKEYSSMKAINIDEDTKNQEFFFTGSYFVFITLEGQQNKLVIIDDKIAKRARNYADKLTPQLDIKQRQAFYIKTDKSKFISSIRLEYWTALFNLGIWNFLELNNKVTYFTEPKE